MNGGTYAVGLDQRQHRQRRPCSPACRASPPTSPPRSSPRARRARHAGVTTNLALGRTHPRASRRAAGPLADRAELSGQRGRGGGRAATGAATGARFSCIDKQHRARRRSSTAATSPKLGWALGKRRPHGPRRNGANGTGRPPPRHEERSPPIAEDAEHARRCDGPRGSRDSSPRSRNALQTRCALALTLAADRILVSAGARARATDSAASRPRRRWRVGAEEVYRNPERAGAMLAAALDAAGLREKRCAVRRAAGLGADGVHRPAAGQPGGFARLPGIARRAGIFPAARANCGWATAPYTLPDGTQPRHAGRAARRAARSRGRNARGRGRRRACRSRSRSTAACSDPHRRCTCWPTAGTRRSSSRPGGGRGGAALAARPGDGSDRRTARQGRTRRPCVRPGGVLPGGAHHPGPAAVGGAGAGARRRISAARRRPPRVVRREAGDGLAAHGDRLAGRTTPTPDDRARRRRSAAVRLLRREAVPFEFVVPQPRRWEATLRRFNTPRGRRIAGAVLAAILLPLFVFFIRSQQESHLAARVERHERQRRRPRRTPAANPPFPPVVRPHAGAPCSCWKACSRAFPEAGDVWAKSIVIKGTTVTCTGFARDQPALSGSARAAASTAPDVSGLHTHADARRRDHRAIHPQLPLGTASDHDQVNEPRIAC